MVFRFGVAVWLTLWLGLVGHAQQGEPSGIPRSEDSLHTVFQGISAAVLDHHHAPPTRQEMLLNAVRTLYAASDVELPSGLSRRVSDLQDAAAIERFLNEVRQACQLQDPEALTAFTRGMLAVVDGPVRLVPATELKVARQIRDNLYVGIGIQLAMGKSLPQIVKTFPGGPAQVGGIQASDLIVSIDGTSCDGESLQSVVQRLRGAKGTKLTVVVAQPATPQETRTLDLVRDVVPFQTIVGVREIEEGRWSFRVRETSPAAYLKVESIRGSTVRELQQLAVQLKAEGFEQLVLDLRAVESAEMRYTVMLAGALQGPGHWGWLETGQGRQELRATGVELFSGWPLVVLVGRETSGPAEWLAATLKESGRAKLLGHDTAGRPFSQDLVDLPGKMGGLEMWTGRMLTRSEVAKRVPRASVSSSRTGELDSPADATRRELLDAALRALGGASD